MSSYLTLCVRSGRDREMRTCITRRGTQRVPAATAAVRFGLIDPVMDFLETKVRASTAGLPGKLSGSTPLRFPRQYVQVTR